MKPRSFLLLIAVLLVAVCIAPTAQAAPPSMAIQLRGPDLVAHGERLELEITAHTEREETLTVEVDPRLRFDDGTTIASWQHNIGVRTYTRYLDIVPGAPGGSANITVTLTVELSATIQALIPHRIYLPQLIVDDC